MRAELVKPSSEHSRLPRSEYASVEQIRDELLPPASTINFGVRADTSTPGERVVSVILANSQVL